MRGSLLKYSKFDTHRFDLNFMQNMEQYSKDMSKTFRLKCSFCTFCSSLAVLLLLSATACSPKTKDETAFDKAENMPCPEKTNRIIERNSSYPKVYCIGFDGRQGPYLEFDAHERLKLSANYSKDTLNGTWTSYHPNGVIDTTGEMKNGERDGVWTQYYVNGNIRSKKTYSANTQNGPVELFYQSGGLMAKGSFTDDLEQGKWFVYNNEGKLARECEMVDGKESNCVIHIKDFQITTKSYNSSELGAL